jgi:hypothetical protein
LEALAFLHEMGRSDVQINRRGCRKSEVTPAGIAAKLPGSRVFLAQVRLRKRLRNLDGRAATSRRQTSLATFIKSDIFDKYANLMHKAEHGF